MFSPKKISLKDKTSAISSSEVTYSLGKIISLSSLFDLLSANSGRKNNLKQFNLAKHLTKLLSY